MPEMIDILNEDGSPTGDVQPRSIVHSKGLWHRVVHIYIFRKTKDGVEFLAHLRSKNKDLHPNTWDTRFGGHVKAGQTIEEAVKQEAEEELGLTVNPEKMRRGKAYTFGRFPNNELSTTYYHEFLSDEKTLRFNDGEVQAVRWLSPVEIVKEMSEQENTWCGKVDHFLDILATLETFFENE